MSLIHGMTRSRTALMGALVTTAALAATLTATGPASAAGPGVCAGVARCRVVAHVDVDGNGTRDAVGITRLGADGAQQGTVVVRVKLGAHRIVKARRTLSFWGGSPWQGAAHLDGRKGDELVVGHTMGAHTEFFRVLTWRRGGLVDLRAPGGSRDWYVDSACSVSVGYLQPAGSPAGTLVRRAAERSCGDATFSGNVDHYVWRNGRFARVSRTTYHSLSEQVAFRWGGWHVSGLARF